MLIPTDEIHKWGYLPGPAFYTLTYAVVVIQRSGCYPEHSLFLITKYSLFWASPEAQGMYLGCSWLRRPHLAAGSGRDVPVTQSFPVPMAESSREPVLHHPMPLVVYSLCVLMLNERAKQRFNSVYFEIISGKHNMIATHVTPFLLAVAALLEINR